MKNYGYIALIGVVLAALWLHFSGAFSQLSCSTLQCILTTDNELKIRFKPEVPLFTTHETAPELAKNAAFTPMLTQLGQTLTHMQQNKRIPLSCAVVGNSQNLTGSGYGGRIDNHTYIFRMNSAPTEGYEADVGARTTHHVFSHFYAGNFRPEGELGVRSYQPDTYNILIPLHEDPKKPFKSSYNNHAAFRGFFINLASALASDPAVPAPSLTRDDMTQLRDVSNLLVLTPDFLWYVNNTWFTPPKRGDKDIASTGFLTLVLAMHLCDEIDLFGFGATKDGAWGHYFDNSNSKPARHQPSYQDEFLTLLEAKDIITIYRGN